MIETVQSQPVTYQGSRPVTHTTSLSHTPVVSGSTMGPPPLRANGPATIHLLLQRVFSDAQETPNRRDDNRVRISRGRGDAFGHYPAGAFPPCLKGPQVEMCLLLNHSIVDWVKG